MQQKKVYTIDINDSCSMIIRQGAFGSGEHETTQSCLRKLSSMEIEGKTLLDIGCGTGILGIAASKLGARMAVGFDPDFSSCITALDCNRMNDVSNNHIICGYAESVSGVYDIIVANIYYDIAMALRDYVSVHLAEGGMVILSGIPIEENYDVRRCYEQGGFKILDLNILDEYSTILLKKGD
ncbi:50S ribosomal protein L11 methyltransferase [Limisalsivibrio acetivorans]|uniref:50S ribosomal protein L11 methyltransferase n=1 Tax=Limisalsivibrio acetivorans TaxID=1304888 RepID=UPI00040CCD6A|nr:50S ribosomal protein L11 methyltransferase [Limisalsivibrio acetivorans]